MANTSFEELRVNTRIKLAAMWAALMFFYIYGDYFALYIPGQAGKIVSGDTLLDNPLKVLAASVLMALPSMVIIISVVGKATLARWVNIIFGIIFTGIMVLIAVTSLGEDFEWSWSSYVFYALIESCISTAIVWHAWRWPKAGA
jgi:hypothetical protein